MSKREAISRCNLIIQKLKKHPASFAEIAEYLERKSEFHGYNFNISKRTFQRDIKEIYSLYDIDIQYDFSQKVYKIVSEFESEAKERMIEAFDLFNALNIRDELSNYVQFEYRQALGIENLYGILHSIKNRLQIHFTYTKFWGDKLSTRKVEPYALKEFKNRWYVVAKDLNDNNIKTFALDRLSNLEITKIKFKKPENFDLEQYFKYSFGIISPVEQKPEEVILLFDAFQGNYVKSMPLHHTQEIIEDTEDGLIIKLKIKITHDFTMEILSYGDMVEVIQPKSLINDIKAIYKNALKAYGK